jgi:hypothetical protein
VPTYIAGRLELPPEVDGDDILVAVNGTVAGTGFVTRDSADGGEIHAIVAEDLVRDGSNDVEILVPGPGGGWLTGTAADIVVEYHTEDGRLLELNPEGNRRVEITKVAASDSGWVVTGWAADVKDKLTPDRIYLFAGDRLLASGPPNLNNENVVRWFKSDNLLHSGFTFEIGQGEVPSDMERITVIAEFGDYAIANPVTLVR